MGHALAVGLAGDLDLLVDRRVLPSDLGRASRADAWDIRPTCGRSPLAGDSSRPVRWSIQVMDDPRIPEVAPDGRRSGDGVDAAARRLVRADQPGRSSTPAAAQGHAVREPGRACRLEVESRYLVDHSGNLQLVRPRGHVAAIRPKTLIHGQGQAQGQDDGDRLAGPGADSEPEDAFDYEPRSVVQDVLGPLDRLPGLHVGQRWESQVINPFTGQVESVRVEVARRDADPLGRQPGQHVRGRAAHVAADR